MKTYEEVAKSVFEKSEKYFEEKAIRAKRIKTATTAMSCFCLAAVLVVGAIAALNSNLTEGSVGGASGEQSAGDGENNENIPVTDVTTTPPVTTSILFEEETTSLPYNSPDNGDITTSVMPDPDDTDTVCQLPVAGVNVPYFIAFDGALYVSYDSGEGGFYAPTGLDVYLAENYFCKVCSVQGRPDHIGVDINSFIHEYKKLFDCDFDIDGTKFQIAYNAVKDIDHACGDKVLQTDDFTVYEAVRLQGEPSGTKEYIVDLLPVLEREFPGLFNDFEDADYADRWWIAVSNNDIPDEYPSDHHDTEIHTTTTPPVITTPAATTHHSDDHHSGTHH